MQAVIVGHVMSDPQLNDIFVIFNMFTAAQLQLKTDNTLWMWLMQNGYEGYSYFSDDFYFSNKF